MSVLNSTCQKQLVLLCAEFLTGKNKKQNKKNQTFPAELRPNETRWTKVESKVCKAWAAGWVLEHREQVVQGHCRSYGTARSWTQESRLQSITSLQHAIPVSQLEQRRQRNLAFAMCITFNGSGFSMERKGDVLKVTQPVSGRGWKGPNSTAGVAVPLLALYVSCMFRVGTFLIQGHEL